MSILNYIVIFIIMIAITFLYEKFKIKQDRLLAKSDYELIREFLANESDTTKQDADRTKPIMWIHVPNEVNARNWYSYYSRNSTNLNLPYLYICIKSIIKNSSGDFNVCLIDDDAFRYLLPKWDIQLTSVAEPVRTHLRKLGLVKLLHRYGGFVVPPSFISLKNMKRVYDTCLREKDCFVIEKKNKSINHLDYFYIPNVEFMGAEAKSETMNKLATYMNNIYRKDFTSAVDVEDRVGKYISNLSSNGEITRITSNYVGLKDENNKEIVVEDLFSTEYIDFDRNYFGVYLDRDEIERRTEYGWFIRCSPKQIYESHFMLAKLLVLTNIL